MSIEWTDETLNPLRARRRDNGVTGWHCEKVSPGCTNCYAETMNRAQRFYGTGYRYTMPARAHVENFLDMQTLDRMHRMRKRKRVFLCDMTDIFGPWVPDGWLDRLFRAMAIAGNVQWQILTKRPERMREYIVSRFSGTGIYHPRTPESRRHPWPLPNVWLGVSAENQDYADHRIPQLLATPAAVRFVSAEPLLGEVDLVPYLWPTPGATLDWVITGGESGGKSRSTDITWLRKLREDCQEAGVPLFVKQLGNRPTLFGERVRVRGHRGQYMEDWPHDLRVREQPAQWAATGGSQ